MKAEKPLTLVEIRRAGLEALARELGPVGMIRFLQQYETGYGDYSICTAPPGTLPDKAPIRPCGSTPISVLSVGHFFLPE